MKKIYSLILFVFLLAQFSWAQEWNAIHTYTIDNILWDRPMVDVSHDDMIITSFQTTETNRAMQLSMDGGETWDVINPNFQRAYVGFDGNGNIYAVNEKEVSGTVLTYTDSLFYSSDMGQTWIGLDNVPDFGVAKEHYYIDDDNKFYCIAFGVGPDFEQPMNIYQNGALLESAYTPFSAGSDNLRGLIKIGNGNQIVGICQSRITYINNYGSAN